MRRISKRWQAVIGGALVALLSGGAAWAAKGTATPTSAPAASPSGSGQVQAEPRGRLFLLGRLSNADLHLVIAGAVHHVRVDRGTVVSVSDAQVVIKELDGVVATVPVSADTRVSVDRAPATLADVKPGMVAFAVRDGDNPARAVHAREAGG